MNEISKIKLENVDLKGSPYRTFVVSLPVVGYNIIHTVYQKSEGSLVMSLQYLRKKRRNADKVSSTITTYLPFLSLHLLGRFFQVQK